MELDVNTFYHCRPLYIYMPQAIFDALEAAFLAGLPSAKVSAEDYLLMRSKAPAEVWPE